MLRIERGGVVSEQLLVLWTLLLEGHVPVVHIVADSDEGDVTPSNEVGGRPNGASSPARAQLVRKEAA